MKFHSAVVILLARLPSALSQRRFGGGRRQLKSTNKSNKSCKSAKVGKDEAPCCKPEVETFTLQSYGHEGSTISFGSSSPEYATDECSVDMCTASWMMHLMVPDTCDVMHELHRVSTDSAVSGPAKHTRLTMLNQDAQDWVTSTTPNEASYCSRKEDLYVEVLTDNENATANLRRKETIFAPKDTIGPQKNTVVKKRADTKVDDLNSPQKREETAKEALKSITKEATGKNLVSNDKPGALDVANNEKAAVAQKGIARINDNEVKTASAKNVVNRNNDEKKQATEQISRSFAEGKKKEEEEKKKRGGAKPSMAKLKQMQPRLEDFDLAGTLFINKGEVSGISNSHYSVVCTILEAGIGDWKQVPYPMVDVTKASCEIDVCSGNFDEDHDRKLIDYSLKEQDCFYLKYSGLFQMQFPLIVGGPPGKTGHPGKVGHSGNQHNKEHGHGNDGRGLNNKTPHLPEFVATLTGGTGKYRGATGIARVLTGQAVFDIELVYISNQALVNYKWSDAGHV